MRFQNRKNSKNIFFLPTPGFQDNNLISPSHSQKTVKHFHTVNDLHLPWFLDDAIFEWPLIQIGVLKIHYTILPKIFLLKANQIKTYHGGMHSPFFTSVHSLMI